MSPPYDCSKMCSSSLAMFRVALRMLHVRNIFLASYTPQFLRYLSTQDATTIPGPIIRNRRNMGEMENGVGATLGL